MQYFHPNQREYQQNKEQYDHRQGLSYRTVKSNENTFVSPRPLHLHPPEHLRAIERYQRALGKWHALGVFGRSDSCSVRSEMNAIRLMDIVPDLPYPDQRLCLTAHLR